MSTRWHHYIDAVMIARWRYYFNAVMIASSSSSTCHERTHSGPGKSVRTLQVAAHQRDGWAGGDAKYNTPCKTTYITTITSSSVGRMPDSQSREPGFESPFATVSKIGHFSFTSQTPLFTQLYKLVPGYRQWWQCE